MVRIWQMAEWMARSVIIYRFLIGVRKTTLRADSCEAVNRAVSQMYLDGTAAALLQKWFGRTRLQLETRVPQFEGCE